MAVPKYIRDVARPVNTVVIDNGKDGPTRYAVRERKCVKYVPGGNPQPQNGKVIGHIIDGVYVPKNQAVTSSVPDMLSYGSSAFAHSVADDLMSELLQVYNARDAYRIMAIAIFDYCAVKAPELNSKSPTVPPFSPSQSTVERQLNLSHCHLLWEVNFSRIFISPLSMM